MTKKEMAVEFRPLITFLVGVITIAPVLLVIGLPLFVVGFTFPLTIPIIFIVAGLLLFSLPGLFHSDPGQPQGVLAAFAYRCNQLIQDEDPKMLGTVSLAKFQMLFWTIILATSYVWLLLKQQQQLELKAPEIPNEWLVLMGISNGTYLLAKFAKTVKERRSQPQEEEAKPKENAAARSASS